jgi:hypothetical protein
MKIHCLVLCIVSPMLSSCTDSSANLTAGNAFMNVPYEVVAEGLQLGIKNQQLHVITNDTQLASFAATAKFTPVIPAIDFDANDVVAIVTGFQGCSGTAVNNVSESKDTLLVEIDKIFFASVACAAVVLETGPYLLVTVPKRGKPVSFTFAVKIV